MMAMTNNPTSTSAVVGQRLRFGAGPGRAAAVAKALTMPVLLAAFATYLLVGIITMTVPPGTAFPGPAFFPGIITAVLYGLAIVLAVIGVREARAPGAAPAAVSAAAAVADGDEALAAADDALPERTVRVDVASLVWVVGSFFAFAFLLPFLGWIIAAGLLFAAVARGFGHKKWLSTIIVGLTVGSITYIGFDMLLGLSLPSGILGGGF